MDFRALPGTPIKAAAHGVVIGTGDTDMACRGASYGRWVMIRHKNGLSTLYAHFDLIKVREGQNVDMGDLLGYSGNTGYSTGPHLHFTVFVADAVNIQDFPSKSCPKAIFRIPVAAQNAYLDPQAYL
jgi:murein DD-endopeptidase MepM/ murein hydrolase activator NlpD